MVLLGQSFVSVDDLINQRKIWKQIKTVSRNEEHKHITSVSAAHAYIEIQISNNI